MGQRKKKNAAKHRPKSNLANPPQVGPDDIRKSGFAPAPGPTELNGLSESLRVTEEQARWLARLPEEDPSPILRVSADGTVLYQNPAAERLPCWRCTIGAYLPQEALRRLIGQAMADGKAIEQEIELGGEWYAVAISPVLAEGYANVYGRNVTQRKYAEQALRESEDRHRSVVENTTAVILRIDPSGIITFANRRAMEFFGYSAEDLIGKHAVGTIVPQRETTGRDLANMVDQISADPDAFHTNTNENMCKDGRRVWLEWTNSGVYDSDGKLKEFLSVGVDATARRQAEEALRQLNAELEQRVAQRTADVAAALAKVQVERKRFLDVLETLPVIIEIIRPDYRVVWENRACREALGDNEGKLCHAAQFGNEKPCRECQAFVPLQTGKPHHWQWTLPDGRTFDIYNFPFTDSDGSPLILEMDIDITQQRQAEAKIRAERQRLYDVLETLPVYVILLTEDYRVPFANRFFEERFGKSQGQRCYEYLFSRNEPCENCDTYKVMKTGQPHHWYWTGPDNRDYDIYDFPFTDIDGSRMILEMGIDITERNRAEQLLRQASAYNRNLIEASLDPLVTIGPDGRITDVNAATEAATGCSRAELIGTDFSDYFTEPDKARAGYEQVFREGSVRDYLLELRHRDGRVISVTYHATIYRDEKGEPVGVFAAARDITHRLQTEAALKELNETLERRVAERTEELAAANDGLAETANELARSNEDLQQFAYVASHDLQEPLRMINGFLKLLEERYRSQLDDKAREYIGYSVEGAARMSQLISDLLDYSRLTTKGKELQPIGAARPLNAALANLRGSIQEAAASMTHDELPTVMGDQVQLMQLFQNLIGNAIKFRSSDRPCKIHVGVRRKDDMWELSVSDNGIGIPKDAFDRIFVIFQRLHTREKYAGTGIGLAIVKKIVERHGGRIWVESAPGEGSTFHFTLSAYDEDIASGIRKEQMGELHGQEEGSH